MLNHIKPLSLSTAAFFWRAGCVSFRVETPAARFQAVESPLPEKATNDHCYPHCNASLEVEGQQNSRQRLKFAGSMLVISLVTLVFSVFRIARLIVAFALSLVGFVGFGLRNISLKNAHPEDRRLLPGSE